MNLKAILYYTYNYASIYCLLLSYCYKSTFSAMLIHQVLLLAVELLRQINTLSAMLIHQVFLMEMQCSFIKDF